MRARDHHGLPEQVGGNGERFGRTRRGMRNGHDDARALQMLIDAGVIDLVVLGDTGGSVYETLIDGSALRTLDDGEAATIGYAQEVGGIALIDERKAMNLCADSFPTPRDPDGPAASA